MDRFGPNDRYLGRRLIAAYRLARWTRRVERAARELLAQRHERALSVVRRTVLAASVGGDPFGMETWEDDLDAELRPVAQAVFADISETTVKHMIGKPGQLPVIDLRGQLDQFIGVMAGLGEDTADALGDTLTVGVNLGESIPKLADRVMSVFTSSESRATTIARTETIRAANETSQETASALANATGLAITKTWLATEDDLLCPECDDLDGETVGIDDDFPDGDPPQHPSCRCCMTFDVPDDAPDASGENDASGTVDQEQED